jgi:hypothetical protein
MTAEVIRLVFATTKAGRELKPANLQHDVLVACILNSALCIDSLFL